MNIRFFLITFFLVDVVCVSSVEAACTVYAVTEAQEYTSWCWIACARAIARNEGIVEKSQEEGVMEIKGSVVNRGGSVEEIQAAAMLFCPGTKFIVEYRPLRFEEIMELIDEGHLISASCGYYLGDTRYDGHSVVICGYAAEDDKQEIYYYDPLRNQSNKLSYQEFCNREVTEGTMVYQQSVYCISSGTTGFFDTGLLMHEEQNHVVKRLRRRQRRILFYRIFGVLFAIHVLTSAYKNKRTRQMCTGRNVRQRTFRMKG